MSIERVGKVSQRLECEECGETTETFNSDEFRTMIEIAKTDGWQIIQTPRGVWEHYCAACDPDGADGESPLDRARRMFGG